MKNWDLSRPMRWNLFLNDGYMWEAQTYVPPYLFNSRDYDSRSTIVPVPMPPPQHMVCKPYFLS